MNNTNTTGSKTVTVDYFFKQQHRRLAEKFGVDRVEAHADRVNRALYARRESLRKEAN